MEKREETMADFEKELEASFRKIEEGDIISGTVIDEIGRASCRERV